MGSQSRGWKRNETCSVEKYGVLLSRRRFAEKAKREAPYAFSALNMFLRSTGGVASRDAAAISEVEAASGAAVISDSGSEGGAALGVPVIANSGDVLEASEIGEGSAASDVAAAAVIIESVPVIIEGAAALVASVIAHSGAVLGASAIANRGESAIGAHVKAIGDSAQGSSIKAEGCAVVGVPVTADRAAAMGGSVWEVEAASAFGMGIRSGINVGVGLRGAMMAVAESEEDVAVEVGEEIRCGGSKLGDGEVEEVLGEGLVQGSYRRFGEKLAS